MVFLSSVQVCSAAFTRKDKKNEYSYANCFGFFFFFKCIVTSFYLFHLFLFISFFFNIIAALRDMTIHNITCTKGLLQEKINCNGF